MFNLCIQQLLLHSLFGLLDAPILLQMQHLVNACVKAGAELYYLLFTDLYIYRIPIL